MKDTPGWLATERRLHPVKDPQEERQAPPPSRYLWLFAGILVFYCAWVLSLPLFPTQDGPVHLYLASIFRGLLQHSEGLYSKYYLIHHYLPPYSFQYYLLVLLMQFISPLLAEKLFVCLILVTFACGFRYLAMGIGESGALFALFGECLLLNWSLAMGFENYLLSLGMAFWAIGFWMRSRQGQANHFRVGFVLTLMLMALTHPVPVAIVLGFAGLDMAIASLASRVAIADTGAAGRTVRKDFFTLLAGSSVLLYILAFTEKGRTASNIRNTIHPFAEFRSFYGHLEGIRFFNGADWRVEAYTAALYLLLIVAASIALLRGRHSSASSLPWRIVLVLFFIALPVVPMDINGSHMFATRLVSLLWLAAFAAASGTRRLPRAAEASLAALAGIVALGILGFAHGVVGREARQIAEITNAAILQQHKLGLLLPGLPQHIPPAYDYVVDPFVWAGAHYFREGQDVLLNTPWTDIPILPVSARPTLGIADFPPMTIEFFYDLRERIVNGDARSLELLSRADFVLFATGGQPVDRNAVQAVLLAEGSSHWSCISATSWTEVCERLPVRKTGNRTGQEQQQ